ncbi:HAD family hydrolase [Streptomyces sp. 8P21H-1]|uniref:HAD family hydrolase n=1 Tax=Streptomyces sp. 8P21H-1 TaxID=2737048 RepID=UPI00156E93EE|nr:HAD family hydrolase [Streptomyces sp. 8P21H-1]NSL42837.1 HAD family hydrolase [Streptomyces sp. 8P21H-1]
MSLLMLDLDNTLVDRDAAFRAAASAFLRACGLPGEDLAWLMSVDAGGYAPREDVARAVIGRYGEGASGEAVRSLLDRGAADRVVLDDAVRDVLAGAVAAGWTCVIVTNGRTAQQEAKIRRTGLDRIVHGWVISEAAGCRKPAPEIFRTAAATAGACLRGAWMIGDSPHADIGGANALDGVRSVWVSAGRPWTEAAFRPTHVTDDITSAITYVVGRRPHGAPAVRP